MDSHQNNPKKKSDTSELYPTFWRPQRLTAWLQSLVQYLYVRPKTRPALMSILRQATQRHLLNNELLEMIEGVFQISEMQVRDVMIARAQMITVNPNEPLEAAIPKLLESSHSRFPVIDDIQDTVLGILLAKDLLRFYYQKKGFPSLKEITHKTLFVPESKRLDTLLKQFRATYNHMAIVVDEYNHVVGLVTIEDVLEQIVGDIEDEHYVEPSDQNITALENNRYLVQALTPIEEFNHYFETHIESKTLDTIGGFIAQQFGHLPKRGETIHIDTMQFKIVSANKRKIQLLEAAIQSHASDKT